MKILVMGAAGMLGHQLCRSLSDRFDVWATVRGNPTEQLEDLHLVNRHLISDIDADKPDKVGSVIEKIHPDVVVNCIGIVKQRDEAKQAVISIQINALFPHQLAALCEKVGVRAIQISTDCVFSGFKGNYSELDNPDPVDLYGRTKLLGELNRSNCLTLRTSIIGWQLSTFSSLLSWFALQRGRRIKGYKRAIYSGLSTTVLAQLIGDIIETRPDLQGLYQVASEPISKYDLLLQLRDTLGWSDIVIEPEDLFFCDRSLNANRFTTATGWQPPSWESMLQGLAAEWPRYVKLYDKHNS